MLKNPNWGGTIVLYHNLRISIDIICSLITYFVLIESFYEQVSRIQIVRMWGFRDKLITDRNLCKCVLDMPILRS